MEYQRLFKIVQKAFPEVDAKLVPFEKDSVMRCSTFSRNIYYNDQLIKKMGFSEKAIVGVIAHELSHKIDFKTKNLFEKLTNDLRYRPYSKYKRMVERKADTITVQRGFGKELLQTMKETKKGFEKERYSKYEAAHLTIKEVTSMIKKRKISR